MAETVTTESVAAMFTPRPGECNKGTFGYIALIGGSERYSGAIRLANMAACAMRCGAGVVRVCAPRGLKHTLTPAMLESTLFALSDDGQDNLRFVEAEFEEALKGIRTVAFGMGIGNTEETEKALRCLLTHFEGTLIIDADGLNVLSRMGDYTGKGPLILTPHPGEFARLSGYSISEILERPQELAVEYAKAHGVTLLLKGAVTTVTDGRRVLLNERGCSGMATAGSGDVLSGILAAICGWWHGNPTEAAAAAAFVNGMAGEYAQATYGDYGMIAGDTARAVAKVILDLQHSFHQNGEHS